MGYRTVVVLSNDLQHDWQSDAELGQKIARAASKRFSSDDGGRFDFGNVVSVEHTDTQQLLVLDSMAAETIAYKSWGRSDTPEAIKLELLKRAADELGFRLSKKPKVK